MRVALLSLVCVVLALGPKAARADQAKTIQLDVGADDLGLDADVLRRTLEDDLGVTIAVGGEPTSPAIVVRRRDERTIAILVRRSTGTGPERLIAPPNNKVVAGETVGLAASNLFRNEASEILAELAPKPPAPPPEEAQYRALIARLTPPAPAPAHRFSCSDGTALPIGADFAPFIGTSSVYPNRVRWFSLNLLGGYSRGLRGYEMAVGVNVESEFMCGVQDAGLANIVLGPVRGVQIAVGNAAAGDMQGLQIGIGNLAADALWGAQVGTANLTAGDLVGGQVGTFNLALSSVRGGQVGAVNVATGDVHGVQLGAINYADRVDAPIGAISIVRHGRTSVETAVTDSGVGASLRHGGRLLHNVYGFGYRFGHDRYWAVSLGIGGHIPLTDRLDLDIDLIYTTLQKDKLFSLDIHGATLQPSLAYAFARPFAVWLAPTLNVLVSHEGEVGGGPPWGKIELGSSGSSLVQGWVGFALGIRAEL